LQGLIYQFRMKIHKKMLHSARELSHLPLSFITDCMSRKIWSSLTATALLVSTLGAANSGSANQTGVSEEGSAANVSLDENSPEVSSLEPQVASTLPLEAESYPLDEASKVGEYQSQETETEADLEAIALIQSHELSGRPATILYVRDIPVITFLGSSSDATSLSAVPNVPNPEISETEVKMGSAQSAEEQSSHSIPSAASLTNAPIATPAGTENEVENEVAARVANDPVWRASALASQINQLHQSSIDPETITVRWIEARSRYVIEVDGEELVEINEDTILAGSTGDPAEDALQAANLLRRLMGNAPPLMTIIDAPQPVEPEPVQEISLGPVRLTISGQASWYGPGFHGRRSASGEIFNQNAMTAAHRTLPFGTQVRVTNTNNGQSVVVRINDRGPYSGGRVIDLSAAAARSLGMTRSGVAPVNIEVLGTTTTASN
jgi:rare lipoprotein A